MLFLSHFAFIFFQAEEKAHSEVRAFFHFYIYVLNALFYFKVYCLPAMAQLLSRWGKDTLSLHHVLRSVGKELRKLLVHYVFS